MIDTPRTGDSTPVSPSLVPIVNLAASAPNGPAAEISRARWRGLGRPTSARIAAEIRSPNAAFRALNAQLKGRVRELFETGTVEQAGQLDRCAENLSVQPDSREAHWQREVTALRLLVAEMREELRGSQLREKLARYLAFHDDLTALPNRRYFLERLGAALNGGPSETLNLAIIYLDLDGFKTINDTHGHEIGDQLLNLVAARLAHVVRAEDLVSRLGGDEYACLVTGVPNPERLQHIASLLFDAVSTPFTVSSRVLTVHPSIGVAVYPTDGTTSEELLKSADTAMYRAKGMRCSYRFSERLVALSATTHAKSAETNERVTRT